LVGFKPDSRFIISTKNIGFDTDVKNARRFGLEAMALRNATEDMREGLAAFLEKCQPVFKDK
jgi:1,4-dihydroxy-2-naphthoyl-CoA synthase